MGIKQDVKAVLEDGFVTQIDEKPHNDDLNKIEHEVCNVAASIMTTNGCGIHWHMGFIVKESEYISFCTKMTNLLSPQIPDIIQCFSWHGCSRMSSCKTQK